MTITNNGTYENLLPRLPDPTSTTTRHALVQRPEVLTLLREAAADQPLHLDYIERCIRLRIEGNGPSPVEYKGFVSPTLASAISDDLTRSLIPRPEWATQQKHTVEDLNYVRTRRRNEALARRLQRGKERRKQSIVRQPRDSQRTKVYTAERKAFSGTPYARPIGDGSVEDVQQWLDYHVLSTRWFRARWGKLTVPVVPGAGSNANRFRIMLNQSGRTPWVVLHELSHVLTWRDNIAGHGPEFCAVYLFLVRYTFGTEAERRLREEFAAGRVKHRKGVSAIPKPTKNVPTKEQEREAEKQQLRARASKPRRLEAALTIRAGVKLGQFGPAGSKSRNAALALVKRLETYEENQ